MKENQKQILIREQIGSESKVFDAATVRGLLAKNGASYTLLDGSSMSPIPMAEGRKIGNDLEIVLPDGTSIYFYEYFGNDPERATEIARFDSGTSVYFEDYKPTEGLVSVQYGDGFAYYNSGSNATILPFPDSDSYAWAFPALAGLFAGVTLDGDSSTIATIMPTPSETTSTGLSTSSSERTDEVHILSSVIKESDSPESPFFLEIETDLRQGSSVQLKLSGQVYSSAVGTDGRVVIDIPVTVIGQLSEGSTPYIIKAIDANGSVLEELGGRYVFKSSLESDGEDQEDERNPIIDGIQLPLIKADTTSLTLSVSTRNAESGDKIYLNVAGSIVGPVSILGSITSISVPENVLKTLSSGTDVPYAVTIKDTKGKVVDTYQSFISVPNTYNQDVTEGNGSENKIHILSAYFTLNPDNTLLSVTTDLDQNDIIQLSLNGQLFSQRVDASGNASFVLGKALIDNLGAGSIPYQLSAIDATGTLLQSLNTSYIFNDSFGDIGTGGPDGRNVRIEGLQLSPIVDDSSSVTMTVVTTNTTEGDKLHLNFAGQLLGPVSIVGDVTSIQVPASIIAMLADGTDAQFSLYVKDSHANELANYMSYVEIPVLENTDSSNTDLALDEVAYFALVTALIEAINNIGSNTSQGSSLQLISSIATTFGTAINSEEVDIANLVTVNTVGIADGETITLTIDSLSYSTQVASNKASFSIPSGVFQSFADGSYTMAAKLESDATVTKSLSIFIDATSPVFRSDEDIIQIAVDENIPVAMIVGAEVADDSSSLSYSITGADSTYFSINSLTGELRFRNSPNYEVKSSYILSVVATDLAGNSASKEIQLSINDVVENTVSVPNIPIVNELDADTLLPVISGTAVVAENEALFVTVSGATYEVAVQQDGTWSLDLEIATPSEGTLTTLSDNSTYEIVAKTISELDSTKFAIDQSTNELNIKLPDITSPVFESNEDPVTLNFDENIPVSTLVYQASATDESTVSYSISGADAADVNIDEQTGEIYFNNSPDFESKDQYALTVNATDLAGNYVEKNIQISVNDLDETVQVNAIISNSAAPLITGAAWLSSGQTLNVEIRDGQTLIAKYTDVRVIDNVWSIDLLNDIPDEGEWPDFVAGQSASFSVIGSIPEISIDSQADLTIDLVPPTVKLWIDTTDTLTESNADMYLLNILFSERLDPWPPSFSEILINGLSFSAEPLVDSQNPLLFSVEFELDYDFSGIGSANVPLDALLDPAGNSLELLDLFNPLIDTVRPPDLVLGLSDTGESATDGVTRSDLVEISGLEKYSILRYSLDGGVSFIDKFAPQGGWTRSGNTYLTAVELAEGQIISEQVRAYQIDVSGNVGDTTSLFLERNYTVDKSIPYFSELFVSSTLGDDGKVNLTIIAILDSSAAIDWTTLDESDASFIQLSNLIGEPNQATLVVPSDNALGTSELRFELQGATIDDINADIIPTSYFLDSLVARDLAGNELPQYSSFDALTVINYSAGPSIIGIISGDSILRPDAKFTVVSFASEVGAKIEFTLDGYSPLISNIDGSEAGAGYLGESSFDLSLLPALVSEQLDNTNLSYTVRMLNENNEVIANVPEKTGVLTFDSTPPTEPVFLDVDGNPIVDGQVDLFENQPYQTSLFFISKSDDTSPVQYQLASGDEQYFRINPDTGGVSIRQDAISGLWQFDFESLSEDLRIDQDVKAINLTVNAVDSAGNIGASASITVRIRNVDESAPVFQADPSAEGEYDAVRSVEEYAEDGAIVYIPGSVDDIFDDNVSRDLSDDVVFSLERTGDFQLLTVDPATGSVSLNSSPDYDFQSVYTFTLVATGASGKSASQFIRVDVNESGVPANFISLQARNPITGAFESIELSEMRLSLGSLEENTELSDYAWILGVDDPLVALTLLDGADQYFDITRQSAIPEYWDLTFKTGVELDYETISALLFRIRAIDEEGAPKDLPLLLNVIDDGNNPQYDSPLELIDTPEVLAGTTFQPTLAELGTGVSGDIKYSILENSGGSNSVPFSVDQETGALTITENLDHETNASSAYNFTLRAANGSEYNDKTITISVSDSAVGAAQVVSAEWNVTTLTGSTLPLRVTFDRAMSVSDISGVDLQLLMTGVDSDGNAISKSHSASLQSIDPTDARNLIFTVTQPLETDFSGSVEVQSISLDSGVSLSGSGGNADLVFSPLSVSGAWEFNNIKPSIERIQLELEPDRFTLTYSEALIIPANTVINVKLLDSDLVFATFNSGDEETISENLEFLVDSGEQISLQNFQNSSNIVFDVTLSQLAGSLSGNTAEGYYNYDKVTLVDTDGTEYVNPNGDGWITVTAGEFVTDALVVRAYNLEGELLGTSDFDPVKSIVRYDDLIPLGFSGPVIINILDGSPALDYLDEFTGQLKDFDFNTGGFGLRALVDYRDVQPTAPIIVTPLTELALRIAEFNTSIPLEDANRLVTHRIYSLFGLEAIQSEVEVITDRNFDVSDGISANEHHGLILAALSTFDSITGGINSTLSMLDPSENFSQENLDKVIEQAIDAIAESHNPFIQSISQELTLVIEKFYEFEQILILPESNMDWAFLSQTTILDLSHYLTDESDFDIFINDQELSQDQLIYVSEGSALDNDLREILGRLDSTQTNTINDQPNIQSDEQIYG